MAKKAAPKKRPKAFKIKGKAPVNLSKLGKVLKKAGGSYKGRAATGGGSK